VPGALWDEIVPRTIGFDDTPRFLFADVQHGQVPCRICPGIVHPQKKTVISMQLAGARKVAARACFD